MVLDGSDCGAVGRVIIWTTRDSGSNAVISNCDIKQLRNENCLKDDDKEKMVMNGSWVDEWRPGLVVMGWYSQSEGCGFESSTVYWMDIFSHIFVVKIVMFVCWKDENKQKRGLGWPIIFLKWCKNLYILKRMSEKSD